MKYETNTTSYAGRATIIAFISLCLLLLSAAASAQVRKGEALARLAQSSSSSDAADKAFQKAMEYISDEEWNKAAAQFNSYIDAFPKEKRIDAALYYAAYALKQEKQWQKANQVLMRLISTYPSSSWAKDAKQLQIQLAPQLSGKKGAIENVFESPDEQVEVKIAALRSLCQVNVERCVAGSTEILRQPNSDINLKSVALSMIMSYGGKPALPMIVNIARSDNDRKLRLRAISALGNTDDESVLPSLKELALSSGDSDVVEAALSAVYRHRAEVASNQAMGDLASRITSVETRKKAISLLSQMRGESAVDELLRLYTSETNPEVRKQVILGFGNRKSLRARDKLVEIARTSDNLEFRKTAFYALARRGGEGSLDIFLQLYDAERNDELKNSILSGLCSSEDKRAITKLMSIARNNGEPVERRKTAISCLSRSKDPEVLAFLESLLR